MQINLQFVYGAGPDNLFGGGLRWLQSGAVAEFGAKIYSPRVIDWTEYDTLRRLLAKWKDPTILVNHSCGNWSGTKAAVELSMEPIPYMMCIAPSMFCSPSPLPPNVRRATQVTSNYLDPFNLGARQLVRKSPVNNKTVLDTLWTGKPHVTAPYSEAVRDRLFDEIRLALKG